MQSECRFGHKIYKQQDKQSDHLLEDETSAGRLASVKSSVQLESD